MLLIATAHFAQAEGDERPCERSGGNGATDFVVTEGAREYTYSLSLKQSDWRLGYIGRHGARFLSRKPDSEGDAYFYKWPTAPVCNPDLSEFVSNAKTRAAGRCEILRNDWTTIVNLQTHEITQDIDLGALKGYAIHYRAEDDKGGWSLLVISVQDGRAIFEAKIRVDGSVETGEQRLKSLLNALDFKRCSVFVAKRPEQSLWDSLGPSPPALLRSSPNLWDQLEGEFGK